MLFRQFFDATSSTYTYLLASGKGREGLIIDPVSDEAIRKHQVFSLGEAYQCRDRRRQERETATRRGEDNLHAEDLGKTRTVTIHDPICRRNVLNTVNRHVQQSSRSSVAAESEFG